MTWTWPPSSAGDPGLTHRALRAITDTYLGYLGRLRGVGVAGLFYAVTGTLNPPQITSEADFVGFSEPYDLEILEEMSGLATIVHTCGEHSRAERLTHWGAAISWDQFLPGNPGLAELAAPVVVGGVDHRRFTEPEVIAAQSRDAAELGRTRPVLVAPPTCSILSSQVTDAGLSALRP